MLGKRMRNQSGTCPRGDLYFLARLGSVRLESTAFVAEDAEDNSGGMRHRLIMISVWHIPADRCETDRKRKGRVIWEQVDKPQDKRVENQSRRQNREDWDV